MKELKIYIAGKVTGEDWELTRLRFAVMEEKLKNVGVKTVINPFKLEISKDTPWDDAMEICICTLCKEANAIMMLDGWMNSKGARKEFHYAAQRSYRLFEERDLGLIAQLVWPTWKDTSKYEFP